jgi:hypothetical protein
LLPRPGLIFMPFVSGTFFGLYPLARFAPQGIALQRRFNSFLDLFCGQTGSSWQPVRPGARGQLQPAACRLRSRPPLRSGAGAARRISAQFLVFVQHTDCDNRLVVGIRATHTRPCERSSAALLTCVLFVPPVTTTRCHTLAISRKSPAPRRAWHGLVRPP